ncbi:MAG: XRE family transcriptional regulator [Bdellovibrionota bacterium]
MQGSVAQNIGKNIKQIREMRGLTQEQLAKLTGVPRPTWANLESGAANPTISLLARVAMGLQVSVEELIGPPRAECKFYSVRELPIKKRGEVLVRRLLPDSLQNIELDRMELPAGSRMVGVPHRAGTREYLTCESGEIELTVMGESWKLGAGDVVVFRGDQKHSYANSGARVAVAYSVVLIGV